MRHLFDRPLGAVIAPHGSLFKYDWTSLAAAGLNFAGSMATNQVNAERAASDMATYLNLVHKQRDWQKEDQQWSEEYSKRLMDYQNAYNSPEAQMERFKKAGLNPYALMNNEGAIGSGQSQSVPSSNPSQHGSVTPFQRPQLDNPMGSAADKIFGASSIKSQRIGALAEFSKALPDLVKSVGKDGAYRIASSFLGTNLDMKRLDDMIEIEYGRQSIAKQREDLALQISQEFDRATADVILANLSLEGHKINAEASELFKRGKLHDVEIDELVTRSAKNLAEKAHLDADTETLDKLRPHVVKSAEMQADLDYFDRQEGAALYEQGSKARTWQVSEYGKNEALSQQVVENNSRAGLINRIVRGNEKRQKRQR